MIKFVLMYALVYDEYGNTSHILTTYATKQLCEEVRLKHYNRDFSCIPHQQIVVVPK